MTDLDHLRHTLAHLLAAAVLERWPDAKLAIGPTIEHGFYYDFGVQRPFTPQDLPKLEKRMRELIRQKHAMTKIDADSLDQAAPYLASSPYKQELFRDLKAQDAAISFYRVGRFVDLCRGGHVENTSEINPEAFKLTSIAGAYWRGDSTKPMLQRIYGVAFATKAELDEHLAMQAEAEKRDHRKLNEQLKIFTTSDLVGPGLPLWLPNGTVMIEELERLAKETETSAGYVRIATPHIAKDDLFKTSGHLPYYAESMFPPMQLKDDSGTTAYYLKAMNCPMHHLVFAAQPRSYRELPLRLAEYGTVYRYEKSGELFGLMRVRSMHMNDAHLYLTPEQFADEFNAVNRMYLKYFKLFGLTKYVMRFSTHDPKELGKKYVDEPELWKQTEDMVRSVLKASKIPYVEVANEAAFYGPKIDVNIFSSIGREFTIATNQVDFAQPRRFNLSYVDSNGTPQIPIVIHRAPLGTHERFIGFLIEHFAGRFPTWLAPVQVSLVPVGKAHVKPCRILAKELEAVSVRVMVEDANETVGYKIRKAEQLKVPYMLVIGDKEIKSTKLHVRVRGKKSVTTMTKKAFVERLSDEIASRKLSPKT